MTGKSLFFEKILDEDGKSFKQSVQTNEVIYQTIEKTFKVSSSFQSYVSNWNPTF